MTAATVPPTSTSPSDLPRPPVGRRIGILGGSFNPAHAGHLHISRQALDVLGLDEVWWLVSPQNPLKPKAGMAPLDTRVEDAQSTVRGAGWAGRRIRVTDIETRLATRYTADTLTALKALYPGRHFVWLMGADNLIQIPAWKGWQAIFRMLPIAVFPRPTYSLRALGSQAARTFGAARLTGARAAKALANGRLAVMKPPVWVFLDVRPHGASATRIRRDRPDS